MAVLATIHSHETSFDNLSVLLNQSLSDLSLVRLKRLEIVNSKQLVCVGPSSCIGIELSPMLFSNDDAIRMSLSIPGVLVWIQSEEIKYKDGKILNPV